MMDKDTAAEMIQAKALGCLDITDNKELNEFLNMGGVFPWKEFGDLQNLCSLLPIILEIETPDPLLKDKVAKRIYDAIAEQKAKMIREDGLDSTSREIIYPETTVLGDQILPSETPDQQGLADIFEDVPIPETVDSSQIDISIPPSEPATEESTISGPGFEIKSTVGEEISLPEIPEIKEQFSKTELQNNDGINLDIDDLEIQLEPEPKTEEPLKLTELKTTEKTESISPVRSIPPVEPEVKSKYRQMLEEKAKRKPVVEDIPLKKEKFVEPEKPKKKSPAGLIIDIILYVLLLAAITFVYLKLSSEINSLKKEVEELKNKNQSFQMEKIDWTGIKT